MYTIPFQDYASFLERASFANISSSENDNDIKTQFEALTEPKAGWYVTNVFFRNNLSEKDKDIDQDNLYPNLKIFENKNLTEKKRNAKGSTSDHQKFDEKFLKQIKKEIEVKDKIEGYFQIFFPAFITLNGVIQAQDTLLIMLNIKKLPVDFYFEFKNLGNSINTYPRLNKEDIDSMDNILNSGLDPVDTTYYEVKYYKIGDMLNNTYSEIIKKLYIDNNNVIKEIEFSDAVADDNITFTKTDMTLKITKPKNNDNVLRLINFFGNDIPKKIVYSNKTTDDARILYYKNCLHNNKKIPDTKKKTLDNGSTENINKISNYYDISFDCKQSKTFLVSNFTPGYHVLNYEPNLIYRLISETETSLTIDFTELYKDIFRNKIIEIDVETL